MLYRLSRLDPIHAQYTMFARYRLMIVHALHLDIQCGKTMDEKDIPSTIDYIANTLWIAEDAADDLYFPSIIDMEETMNEQQRSDAEHIIANLRSLL